MTSTDSSNDVYRSEFSQNDGSPSLEIVRAVAARCDTDPMSLSPLNESIPCDPLDTIIQDTQGVEVTFSYEGLQITITSDGQIVIRNET